VQSFSRLRNSVDSLLGTLVARRSAAYSAPGEYASTELPSALRRVLPDSVPAPSHSMAQITPTITGSGSVTVVVLGYSDSPGIEPLKMATLNVGAMDPARLIPPSSSTDERGPGSQRLCLGRDGSEGKPPHGKGLNHSASIDEGSGITYPALTRILPTVSRARFRAQSYWAPLWWAPSAGLVLKPSSTSLAAWRHAQKVEEESRLLHEKS